MYFCDDAELLVWEPLIFTEEAFAHQRLVKEAAGTLAGTALTMGAAVLGDVKAGMVARVALADGTLSQLAEVVNVADSSHATVSAVRARDTDPAIPLLFGGAVKVTVVTFMPQIAAVGDALLASIGVVSDRGTEPTPVFAAAVGFKPAAIFGTLAAVYRVLASEEEASAEVRAKRMYYEGLAQAARLTISATVDQDSDGVPETRVWAGVRELSRA